MALPFLLGLLGTALKAVGSSALASAKSNIMQKVAPISGALDMTKGLVAGDAKKASAGLSQMINPQVQQQASQPLATATPTPENALTDTSTMKMNSTAPALSKDYGMKNIPPDILMELYRRRGQSQV